MHYVLMSPLEVAFALHPSPHNASRACSAMSTHLVEDNMRTSCANHPLPSIVSSKIPSKPQHPIVLHPWGCSCSIVIEGDFVHKGAEQFSHSPQGLDLEYKKYLVLLFWEQLILVVLVEKKKGE
jgi:hypothetical protein